MITERRCTPKTQVKIISHDQQKQMGGQTDRQTDREEDVGRNREWVGRYQSVGQSVSK